MLSKPAARGPLTASDLLTSLARIWSPKLQSERSPAPRRFGLAISGGVDSMALAALCSDIQSNAKNFDFKPLKGPLSFKAFVVDHGAREGSAEEAEKVADVLRTRGIPTNVLGLSWHGEPRPSGLPNFESLARKHRFQALGKACRDHGLESLLFAHHEDDQAETIMMRVAMGHKGRGLLGMKAMSNIPECYGIYGVSGSSGGARVVRQHPCAGYVADIKAETGGITICRPLLGFSKQALIATCKHMDMPWFEDSTNQDPTLTPRNAVRHVLESGRLPTALQKPSLLALREISGARYDLSEAIAQEQFEKSEIKDLEPRSGIIMSFKPSADLFSANWTLSPIESPVTKGLTKREMAALLVRRVVELVTPREHIANSHMGGIVEKMFPHLVSEGGTKRLPIAIPTRSVKPFTSAGLLFTPLLEEGWSQKKTVEMSEVKWRISRQLYGSKGSDVPLMTFPPPDGSNSAEDGSQKGFSEWALWDGRWWIRVLNKSQATMIVRPFRKEDLMEFRAALPDKKFKRLPWVLKKLAPDDTRWTLPAMVMVEKNGTETVIALPTLDWEVRGAQKLAEWEVRYRAFDLEYRAFDKEGFSINRIPTRPTPGWSMTGKNKW